MVTTTALQGQTWIRLAVMGLLLIPLLLVVALPVCYSLARRGNHLDQWGQEAGWPAISNLGDYMPEHGIFAAVFVVTTLLLCWVSVARLWQLRAHAFIPAAAWYAGVVMACLPVPFLVMMAALSSKGPRSTYHFLGAGVGVTCLSLFMIWVSALALHHQHQRRRHSSRRPLRDQFNEGEVMDKSVSVLDPYWEPAPRHLYWMSLGCACIGCLLFAVWIVDIRRTYLEWLGVALVSLSYAPLLPLLYHHGHRSPRSQREESGDVDALLQSTSPSSPAALDTVVTVSDSVRE